MKPSFCPHCTSNTAHFYKYGSFYRTSDKVRVARFLCGDCCRTFSEATFSPAIHQNKRQLNAELFSLLAKGMSQNGASDHLKTTRKTIARKLKYLSRECVKHTEDFQKTQNLAQKVQFDELVTSEHTKCKPISLALSVEPKKRRILGFQVSSMAANGLLASISVKKYGKRKDDRRVGLQKMLEGIKPLCVPSDLKLASDLCPFYPMVVQKVFGNLGEIVTKYARYKGRKGCVTGQGELKKQGFDAIFSLNHTFAMLRANINRLFRKTWNTTKKMQCLEWHVNIYVLHHNFKIEKLPFPTFV